MAYPPKHSMEAIVSRLRAIDSGVIAELGPLMADPTRQLAGPWSKTSAGEFYSIRYRPKGVKNGETIGPRALVEVALRTVLGCSPRQPSSIVPTAVCEPSFDAAPSDSQCAPDNRSFRLAALSILVIVAVLAG